jgi:hypothetical protein
MGEPEINVNRHFWYFSSPQQEESKQKEKETTVSGQQIGYKENGAMLTEM